MAATVPTTQLFNIACSLIVPAPAHSGAVLTVMQLNLLFSKNKPNRQSRVSVGKNAARNMTPAQNGEQWGPKV
jgi:hypothetical protein